VVADPTTDGNNIGQRFILPSSFSGSSRNMIQHCQDALAINRYFHGADLFLTMTANPNWPEIKRLYFLDSLQQIAQIWWFMFLEPRPRSSRETSLRMASLERLWHVSEQLNSKNVVFLTFI